MDTVWCRAQLRVIIRAITFIPKGWPIILNYDEYIKPDGSNPYFDSDSMFFFLKLLLLSLLLVVYPSPLISPLIFPPPLPSIPSSSPPFPFVTKKICRWVRNRAACTIHLGKQQYPSSYQHCGSPYAPQRFQTWKEKTQKRKAIVTNKNETNVCNLQTRMQVLNLAKLQKITKIECVQIRSLLSLLFAQSRG